jgi:hypothetical protein
VHVWMSGFQHVDEGLDMSNNRIVWTHLLQLHKVCSRILVTRYSKGLLRISTTHHLLKPDTRKAPSHLQWDCNSRHKCAIVATTISCQCDKSAKFLCNSFARNESVPCVKFFLVPQTGLHSNCGGKQHFYGLNVGGKSSLS